jgi:hypothetical protein
MASDQRFYGWLDGDRAGMVTDAAWMVPVRIVCCGMVTVAAGLLHCGAEIHRAQETVYRSRVVVLRERFVTG